MRNLKAFLRMLSVAKKDEQITATEVSKLANTPIAVTKEMLEFGIKKGFFTQNIKNHQLVYSLTKAGNDFAAYVKGYEEIFVN